MNSNRHVASGIQDVNVADEPSKKKVIQEPVERKGLTVTTRRHNPRRSTDSTHAYVRQGSAADREACNLAPMAELQRAISTSDGVKQFPS
ncbi:hypothetical protein Patl1_08775 [Pistacia atlantica]|uniref:Uncharacterized protein n=1 Tax=Pistacia atlantica TaxID=434234 RepID=A0ACC1ALZ5_9ROSI|nr:hypothetical protein Patl1_08775 [Pistacia atlantica]